MKCATPPKVDAKFKCSIYRKETFKLIKNSFDDSVKDHIRVFCRTILDYYIMEFILKFSFLSIFGFIVYVADINARADSRLTTQF